MTDQFKVGDKAVYAKRGVGEVVAIEKRDIAGKKLSFYVLKFVDGMKLMVPTDAADAAGLRGVISKKTAEEVIEVLRTKQLAVTGRRWRHRSRSYNEMLYSGSPFEVAKVLRDLGRLNGEKDLSDGEKRLLELARRFLVAEVAAARRCKEERVEAEIATILSA